MQINALFYEDALPGTRVQVTSRPNLKFLQLFGFK